MTASNPIDIIGHGMIRVGVATPALRIADIAFNLEQIYQTCHKAIADKCHLVLFPELCMTGYTCGDLFFQQLLQDQVESALLEIANFTQKNPITLVVGAPLSTDNRLFNCAVMISNGEICGVVPKTYLPNTGEFYEKRWFSSARERNSTHLSIGGLQVPFGEDLLFQIEEFAHCKIGIEICEDLWSVVPPSSFQALAGATLILNPSASPEIIGKHGYRRKLVESQSARCLAAYAYASSGPNESTTDLVYSGHSMIAENGKLLAESKRFDPENQLAIADVDLAHLVTERQLNSSFATGQQQSYRIQTFSLEQPSVPELQRPVAQTPFVPPDDQERSQRCHEIFQIQTSGLAKRLRHTGCRNVVIGLSGGLDSTLALLVTIKAFDLLNLDRSGIISITMPGFGTTSRTKNNAALIAEQLGTELRTIPINAAVLQHFKDIGHDETQHDVTYENCQARERTQILMDVANKVGGLVIGTGDLSESALGWCTYNGDHMSMYAVNVGVPKTLVRYLVAWCAQEEFSGPVSVALNDVCDTPVSPELLPPDKNGDIAQKTEQLVGPYELHDFFLYHVVRMHFAPQKIYMLAKVAFKDTPDDEILNWLRVFYRRFFSQQFKRSCMPDGPKVGTVALSPRGDWRMPSDATVALWLKQLEQV